MTVAIIITFCVLLLMAYVFDLTSSKTKIPPVILLLILGWISQQIAVWLELSMPNFSEILPVFGTFGLILIVLEGSLELELDRSKYGLIRKSFIGALFPMFGLAFLIAFLFQYFTRASYTICLLNAIPFCVISSAIAIPSVRNLPGKMREFVTYESSFSDIFGVLFFNFLAINETITAVSFANFGLQMLIICLVSIVATIGLSFLLSKIDHHVKFVPIVLLIMLIYEISKIYHLPGLVFILFFGLALSNLDKFKRFKSIQYFKPEVLSKEIVKFRDLTAEATFIIRSLFFLLFGFLINTDELLNPDSIISALIIVALIFAFRTLQLKVSGIPLKPLLFVAPRGLITILLFLSIETQHNIWIANRSLIIQVILISAVLMMLGLMADKTEKPTAIE